MRSPSHGRGIVLLSGLVLALALSACGGGAPAPGRGLLIVTLDTVAASHCSLYGYSRETTPFLEELARQGVVFDDAIAPSSTTEPAHATLFSGLNPIRNGVRLNGLILPSELVLLPEILQKRGWATGGFVSAFPVGRLFGFNRGFETFDEKEMVIQKGQAVAENRLGSETVDRALNWIGRLGPDRPFFLWVHLYDAHHPYDPPPEVAQAFGSGGLDSRQSTIRDYDRDVLYVDGQVRRLFQALEGKGLLRQTDWIVAADHGEAFWEHGLVGHSPHLYQEQLHIPFLMGGPGIAPGRIAGAPVGLIDVLPTLLGRFGIEPRGEKLEGRDLAPLLAGWVVPEDWNRPLFAVRRLYNQPSFAKMLQQGRDGGWDLPATRLEEQGFGPMAALVQGSWKLIWALGPGGHLPEVYDLERDPEESHDLQDPEGAVQAALKERLARWVGASVRKALTAPPAGEAAFRRLAELGYVHLPDEPAPRPSGEH